MTRSPEDPPEGSVAQIAQVYERYGRSRRRARAWAASNRGNVLIREELRSALLDLVLPRLADGPLLDIGCGTGWWLRALVDRGVEPDRLRGVDLLETRVRAARQTLANVQVQWADARDLPYAGDEFAVATLVVTLSSLPDAAAVESAAREARRVVAPGGLIVVYEPRYRNPLNRHTRVVTPDQLAPVLGEPVVTRTLTLAPPVTRRLGRLAPVLYPRLQRAAPLRTHALSGYRVP